jgi:hypothetical protein
MKRYGWPAIFSLVLAEALGACEKQTEGVSHNQTLASRPWRIDEPLAKLGPPTPRPAVFLGELRSGTEGVRWCESERGQGPHRQDAMAAGGSRIVAEVEP